MLRLGYMVIVIVVDYVDNEVAKYKRVMRISALAFWKSFVRGFRLSDGKVPNGSDLLLHC